MINISNLIFSGYLYRSRTSCSAWTSYESNKRRL